MSILNPDEPYFLKVTWVDSGENKEQILDTKMASVLLYELEMRKGIKAKFTLEA